MSSFEIEDLELPEATVYLMPFPLEDGFELLRHNTEWGQQHINLPGGRRPLPRLTAWYGDSDCVYSYSGIANKPLAWTPLLQDIRDRLASVLAYDFNSVLLNYYRDGRDSIGFHADDERELGHEPVIASLSFGGARRFVFRHKERRYRDVTIPLVDQSLLIMMGTTQTNWLHGVPKEDSAEPRINLTFRKIQSYS